MKKFKDKSFSWFSVVSVAALILLMSSAQAEDFAIEGLAKDFDQAQDPSLSKEGGSCGEECSGEEVRVLLWGILMVYGHTAHPEICKNVVLYGRTAVFNIATDKGEGPTRALCWPGSRAIPAGMTVLY